MLTVCCTACWRPGAARISVCRRAPAAAKHGRERLRPRQPAVGRPNRQHGPRTTAAAAAAAAAGRVLWLGAADPPCQGGSSRRCGAQNGHERGAAADSQHRCGCGGVWAWSGSQLSWWLVRHKAFEFNKHLCLLHGTPACPSTTSTVVSLLRGAAARVSCPCLLLLLYRRRGSHHRGAHPPQVQPRRVLRVTAAGGGGRVHPARG